jgi:plastocyanin
VTRAAILAACALFAAGCGQSDDAGAPVRTTEVVMPKSYRFDPKTIQVAAGAKVTWRNEDNFTHTVKVEGMGDHEVEPGDAVVIDFPKAGRYEYVCTLHSHDMKGTVIVQ